VKRNIYRAAIAAAALSWVVGIAVGQAEAAPTAPAWSVYQGSQPVSNGNLVDGTISIQGTSRADTAYSIRSMKLDATGPGGTYCVIAQSSSSPLSTSWDTNSCSGSTANGQYTLKMTATESNGLTSSSTSSTFTVYVNNSPSAPNWYGGLVVTGASQRQPVVTLRWKGAPEPGVREYHFIRTDPNGNQHEYAISASNPGGQGCEQNTSTYICYDDAFPSSGFGGRYTYSLVAYRSSPSSTKSCTLGGGGDCITSAESGSQAISITEPPPPKPTPTSTGTPGGGSGGGGPTLGGGSLSGPGANAGPTPAANSSKRPTSVLGSGPYDPSDCFTCGSYSKTLPYGQGRVLVPGGSATQPSYALGSPLAQSESSLPGTTDEHRRTLVSIAGGLLLMLGAAHMGRALRRSSH
jgi:hypothetical protein